MPARKPKPAKKKRRTVHAPSEEPLDQLHDVADRSVDLLPSKWGKSKNGKTYFEIVKCTKRDELGRTVYRLRYFFFYKDGRAAFVEGNGLWTRDELLDCGIKFLKNKPTKSMVDR